MYVHVSNNEDITNRRVLLGRKHRQRWHMQSQTGGGNGFHLASHLSLLQYLVVIYLKVYVESVYACYKKCCSKKNITNPPSP